MSTDCEADALTTTLSPRVSIDRAAGQKTYSFLVMQWQITMILYTCVASLPDLNL